MWDFCVFIFGDTALNSLSSCNEEIMNAYRDPVLKINIYYYSFVDMHFNKLKTIYHHILSPYFIYFYNKCIMYYSSFLEYPAFKTVLTLLYYISKVHI